VTLRDDLMKLEADVEEVVEDITTSAVYCSDRSRWKTLQKATYEWVNRLHGLLNPLSVETTTNPTDKKVFYIDADADDVGEGTKERPFMALRDVRDAVGAEPCIIRLAPGTYEHLGPEYAMHEIEKWVSDE